ncbi:hypothetical protein [Hydrogenophaga sp. 5NK40-0174]|uniref:hypothetical protein n=1 Tax=Hydrogenophaga sp. 5NK40-0174 TaxID=3127649 RepID=UPI003101CC55
MSTYAPVAAAKPLPAAATERGVYTPKTASTEARGLATLLLAAVVAALVVVADRLIDTWADGHLLLAWVMLWAVVFAGTALFAGTARRVATRTLKGLDGWSQKVAESRAEARLWDLAKRDPSLMNDLLAAKARQSDEPEDYSAALAPLSADVLGPVAAASKGDRWERYLNQLAVSRTRHMHLYYV